MKVSGTTGSASAGGVRSTGGQTAASGFSPAMPSGVSGPSGVASARPAGQVSSLEALIAMQEVGGPLERKKRAVGRASHILDALENLKLDLLEGRLSPSSIASLTRAVRDQRSLTDDPRLEGVLDEVETRAAVELAKLEMAGVAT
jgi:hypothetical protein